MNADHKHLSRFGSLTLLMVASLTIMVGCVIVPGLPNIASALDVADAAGWLVTLPSLGVVLFAPVAGHMIDGLGARTALCIGLTAYGFFGLATAALHGPVMVFADRIALGGSTALVMAGGTGLIARFHDGDARMAMIARQGMAIELGGVIFLFVGGLLATLHWAAPFALYATSLVFLALVLAFIPSDETVVHGEAVDHSPIRQSLMVVYSAALLSMTCFFCAIIILPFRLLALGVGESGTGYLLSFVSLIAVVAAACMPLAVRRLGERGSLVTAFLAYVGAHICFATAPGLSVIVGGAVMLGIGFGLSVPLVNVMTVERSGAAERGRRLALLSMAIFLGQFLASFVDFLPRGTALPFVAAAALAAASAFLSFIHPGLRSTAQTLSQMTNGKPV
ncbi:MFS transporter [Gluconobacter cerinus]|uniref:MFS transporter n=1 Tax=Gluconobacter cerinus TaxID=38307 RepID=A0AAV5NK49_9PROT|nr:MFS transporter [Gluconobacter cerinus]GLQ64363.1 MFS transporter [Gluconobacter cerinus]